MYDVRSMEYGVCILVFCFQVRTAIHVSYFIIYSFKHIPLTIVVSFESFKNNMNDSEYTEYWLADCACDKLQGTM